MFCLSKEYFAFASGIIVFTIGLFALLHRNADDGLPSSPKPNLNDYESPTSDNTNLSQSNIDDLNKRDITTISSNLNNIKTKSIIESLNNAIPVIEIRRDGLRIGDGRIIQLKHIILIPCDNPIFKESTLRGIEIQSDGTVYGLIDVWHWCGNDQVGKHTARVDLSALAFCLGAKASTPLKDELQLKDQDIIQEMEPKYGFRIGPSEYNKIMSYSKLMKQL